MKPEFRSHYPPEWLEKQTIPYRNIVGVNEQIYRESLTFNYTIKTTLHRQHFNPPIWKDCHFHDFEETRMSMEFRFKTSSLLIASTLQPQFLKIKN